MKFLEFFQGQEGENSAKRLIGIAAGIAFCILSIYGGFFLLQHEKLKEFQDLIETVSIFSGGLLGIGIADLLIKKKYGSKPKNNSSN